MAGLGYDRYGAQGGDWGSIVTANVADLAPDRVVGLHLNFVVARPPAGERTAARRRRPGGVSTRCEEWRRTGARLPGDPGHEAADRSGTGSRTRRPGWPPGSSRSSGRGATAAATSSESFTKDQLLTNITAYWVDGDGDLVVPALLRDPPRPGRRALPVGTASACRPASPTSPARSPACRGRGWSPPTTSCTGPSIPRGGHFAAMEVPDLFVDDVRAFFAGLRSG